MTATAATATRKTCRWRSERRGRAVRRGGGGAIASSDPGCEAPRLCSRDPALAPGRRYDRPARRRRCRPPTACPPRPPSRYPCRAARARRSGIGGRPPAPTRAHRASAGSSRGTRANASKARAKPSYRWVIRPIASRTPRSHSQRSRSCPAAQGKPRLSASVSVLRRTMRMDVNLTLRGAFAVVAVAQQAKLLDPAAPGHHDLVSGVNYYCRRQI